MRLSDSKDSVLELKILGYQFPDIETEKYDSNWLIIEIYVTHPKGHWVARDPCLLTFEVTRLTDWFASISRGGEVKPIQRFIEPNLEFRLVAPTLSQKLLRVYFEVGFRPDWAPWGQGLMRDLWLEFQVSELNLEAAVKSLRQQLAKYPQRAVG